MTVQRQVRGYLTRTAVAHNNRQNASILIQSLLRSWLCQKLYLRKVNGATLMQALVRRTLTQVQALKMRKDYVTIQSTWREFKARRQYIADRNSVTLVQRLQKQRYAKKTFTHLRQRALEHGAAIQIQKETRRYRVQQVLPTLLLEAKSAIRIQKSVRGWQTRDIVRCRYQHQNVDLEQDAYNSKEVDSVVHGALSHVPDRNHTSTLESERKSVSATLPSDGDTSKESKEKRTDQYEVKEPNSLKQSSLPSKLWQEEKTDEPSPQNLSHHFKEQKEEAKPNTKHLEAKSQTEMSELGKAYQVESRTAEGQTMILDPPPKCHQELSSPHEARDDATSQTTLVSHEVVRHEEEEVEVQLVIHKGIQWYVSDAGEVFTEEGELIGTWGEDGPILFDEVQGAEGHEDENEGEGEGESPRSMNEIYIDGIVYFLDQESDIYTTDGVHVGKWYNGEATLFERLGSVAISKSGPTMQQLYREMIEYIAPPGASGSESALYINRMLGIFLVDFEIDSSTLYDYFMAKAQVMSARVQGRVKTLVLHRSSPAQKLGAAFTSVPEITVRGWKSESYLTISNLRPRTAGEAGVMELAGGQVGDIVLSVNGMRYTTFNAFVENVKSAAHLVLQVAPRNDNACDLTNVKMSTLEDIMKHKVDSAKQTQSLLAFHHVSHAHLPVGQRETPEGKNNRVQRLGAEEEAEEEEEEAEEEEEEDEGEGDAEEEDETYEEKEPIDDDEEEGKR